MFYLSDGGPRPICFGAGAGGEKTGLGIKPLKVVSISFCEFYRDSLDLLVGLMPNNLPKASLEKIGNKYSK